MSLRGSGEEEIVVEEPPCRSQNANKSSQEQKIITAGQTNTPILEKKCNK